MEDYYKQEFENLHRHVKTSKNYIHEKLSRAKFDGANKNYIKQLEIEYYAIEAICTNMNAIHRDRPRVQEETQ
ncbi:hypothetical protein [Staphylococcus warneri]|uniref:hypothetical protein n=1 Tax=Staphylococcus warneri TaxID=1292 RepID=UPI0034CF9A44